MMEPLVREGVEIMLERIANWPKEALDEFFRLLDQVEAKYGLTYQLSDEERAAILRSLEDVKAGRYASDEEVDALFARFREDK